MTAATWEELGVMPPARISYFRGLMNPVELAASDKIRLALCVDELERVGAINGGAAVGMRGPIWPSGSANAAHAVQLRLISER